MTQTKEKTATSTAMPEAVNRIRNIKNMAIIPQKIKNVNMRNYIKLTDKPDESDMAMLHPHCYSVWKYLYIHAKEMLKLRGCFITRKALAKEMVSQLIRYNRMISTTWEA